MSINSLKNEKTTMFSVMELRLIRYAVSRELEISEQKLRILDPDSDESIELGNDSMILRRILEKIAEREDV